MLLTPFSRVLAVHARGLDGWDAYKCMPLVPGWISSQSILELIIQSRTRIRHGLGVVSNLKTPWRVGEGQDSCSGEVRNGGDGGS